MKNGRPPIHGVYQDPGGQAGLRYWDGSRWSPLLPPGAVTGWFTVWTNTTARWTELPVANEPWDYPATRAARSKAWIRVSGVLVHTVDGRAPVLHRDSGQVRGYPVPVGHLPNSGQGLRSSRWGARALNPAGTSCA